MEEQNSKNKKLNYLVSNQCFLKCHGCYNRFSKSDLKQGQIFDFFSYTRANDVDKITLSGGDPLARPDILEIVDFLQRLDYKINLDTVGTTFIKDCEVKKHVLKKVDNIGAFKNLEMLGIPLDGSNNEIISSFRHGREDIFGEQIKILSELEKNDIGFCVNTVFHNKNKHDFFNIFNILKSFKNIKKWQVFQFMPIGAMGKLNANHFNVSNGDIDIIGKVLKEFKKDSHFDIVLKTAKERSFDYMFVGGDGEVYKTDINDSKKVFGDVKQKDTWQNIVNNL